MRSVTFHNSLAVDGTVFLAVDGDRIAWSARVEDEALLQAYVETCAQCARVGEHAPDCPQHEDASGPNDAEDTARRAHAAPLLAALIEALRAVDAADQQNADTYEPAMEAAHALVRAALRKAGVPS